MYFISSLIHKIHNVAVLSNVPINIPHVPKRYLNPNIDAKNIIPIHYNTFEAIHTDVQTFVKKVELQGKTVRVLSVGESL